MQDDQILSIAEVLISRLLRTGVAVSAAIVVTGMALVFVHHPSYHRSHAELTDLTSVATAYPHSIGGVLESVREGKGQGLAMLGLLVLIATPVLRVAASIVLFAIERDATFIVITAIVFTLLILSFVIGAAAT